jgi:membrane fusion protein (multidrug efflux system)
MAEASSTPVKRNGARKRWLLLASGFFAAVGIMYGAYWFIHLRHYERTDDAYVAGNVVQVTPQVPGTVVSVNADDTDLVTQGQPLVALDRADAEVALAQSQAALAQTVRETRQLYTANSTWGANIAQKDAEIARAKADLAKAEDDLARRAELASSGAVSGEEMNHAQASVTNARAALAAAQAAATSAKQQLATNESLTEGTTVEKHPNVERAAAKVREQYLTYARAVLPAPVTGYVAKRTVQVGQRVAPGAPLMSIIPLEQVWVDANFKEVQLRKMRIGQPVTLIADAYGDAVEYHGTIAGLGVGTGAAFALLPAQNATGNWIKVVQRVPVRIALDQKELASHPLRVGLSMEVSVDVANTEGKALASVARTDSPYTTTAFNRDAEDADAIVRKTIAANLGRPMSGTSSATAAAAKGGVAETAPSQANARGVVAKSASAAPL